MFFLLFISENMRKIVKAINKNGSEIHLIMFLYLTSMNIDPSTFDQKNEIIQKQDKDFFFNFTI